MKKIFSLMAVVLAAATVFTSCQKDSNSGSYPDKLNGAYGEVAEIITYEEKHDTAYIIDAFILIDNEKDSAMCLFSEDAYPTVKIEGKFAYDSTSGRGTITCDTATVTVQARKDGGKKITATYGTKTHYLTLLTDVGFKGGKWHQEGAEYVAAVDLTVDAQGGTLKIDSDNYTLNTIYGFYYITAQESVGIMEFSGNSGSVAYFHGFRNDRKTEGNLRIGQFVGYDYFLNKTE